MLSEKGLDLFWNRVLGNGRRTVITRVPGSRLRVILDWVYSERAMQGVFGPALADMQDEWFQAIVDGKKLKACWVRIRGYYSVYSAVGLHVAVSAGRKLLTAWNMGK